MDEHLQEQGKDRLLRAAVRVPEQPPQVHRQAHWWTLPGVRMLAEVSSNKHVDAHEAVTLELHNWPSRGAGTDSSVALCCPDMK